MRGAKSPSKSCRRSSPAIPIFSPGSGAKPNPCGQLNHPNVVAAYTTGEERGLNFYVMEYCDGEPLDKLLKREKRLPWDRCVDLTLQIARGLKHAHDKHIIHRDIKPGNIFVTREGVAKILDMGLSKNLSDAEQSFNTVTGMALGTPHYISPEQARGEKNVDGRSDIYSLGATLYQLLTGTTPFQGSSPAVIMMKHLNEKLPNPQDLVPEMPDGVSQVLQKMMAKEPADRYADCAGLIADLELVAQGHMPENADVTEDKSSVMEPAIPRTGVDRSRGKKPVGPRAKAPTGAQQKPPVKAAHVEHAAPKTSHAHFFVGGAVAAVVLVAIAGFGLPFGPKQELPRSVPPAVSIAAPVAPEKAKSASAEIAANKIAVAPSTVNGNTRTSPGSASIPDNAPVKSTQASPVENPVKEVPKPAASAPRQTIDLLALTDPVKDRVSRANTGENNWERKSGSLRYTTDGKAGKIAAPVAIRAAKYAIVLEYRVLSGEGDIHIDLPLPGSKYLAIMIGPNSIHLASTPKYINIGRVPASAASGGNFYITVDCKDGQDALTILAKGEAPIEWKGSFGDVARSLGALHPEFPDEPTASIFCTRDSYEFSDWSLRVFEGEAKVLRTPAAPVGAVENDTDDPARWASAIDLMKFVDPKKDAVEGDWKLEGGELKCGGSNFARLALPYRPSGEYDFRILFTRTEGHGGVTQHVARSHLTDQWYEVNWLMGGYVDTVCAFENVDGKSGKDNATTFNAGLENGRVYESIVKVRSNSMKAYLDGKLISECASDGSNLSVYASWKLPNASLLGIGCQKPTVFHNIEVFEVSRKGKVLRAETSAVPVAKEPEKKPADPIAAPADDAWVRSVQAETPANQSPRVFAKLMELNRGATGVNGAPVISNGQVTEFTFASRALKDVSPVRALVYLQKLSLSGEPDKPGAALHDLTPLAKLKLTDFNGSNSGLNNLSALKGMPLKTLNVQKNPDLSDLSPLSGSTIVSLNIRETAITESGCIETNARAEGIGVRLRGGTRHGHD